MKFINAVFISIYKPDTQSCCKFLNSTYNIYYSIYIYIYIEYMYIYIGRFLEKKRESKPRIFSWRINKPLVSKILGGQFVSTSVLTIFYNLLTCQFVVSFIKLVSISIYKSVSFVVSFVVSFIKSCYDWVYHRN